MSCHVRQGTSLVISSTISSNAQMTRTSVALRVHGTNLDRDVLNARLGRDATHFHKSGDIRVGASGREYSAFREDLWEWESQAEHHGNASEDIATLLSNVDHDGVKALISEGCIIDIFVGIFLDEELAGVSLSPMLMLELGRLGIIVDLSLYP